MVVHPEYDAATMAVEDVDLFLKRALLTAITEMGIELSARTQLELVPVSLVPSSVFTASDLWSSSPENFLPIIASRVQRLVTG